MQLPDLDGRTCVITGATSGIGKVTACTLAGSHANLFLVGRNEDAGEALAAKLRRRAGGRQIAFIRADLSQSADVRTLAATVVQRCDRVDILINNAGARSYAYKENSDGIESTFAANHLGHFLLTCLLVDRLRRASSARVVTISSGLHASVTATGEWILHRENYDGNLAYAKSKLANVMFAYELARRLRHTSVTSNVLNPGVVATNFERNNGVRRWIGFLVGHALKRRLLSAKTAAGAVVFVAASPTVQGMTEKYFVGTRAATSAATSYDTDAAARLWELSARLTGLTCYESIRR